jgi:hypothetical protein
LELIFLFNYNVELLTTNDISMKNINKFYFSPLKSITAIVIVLLFYGCKKLVEVDSPFTSTNEANVYTNDGSAASVLTGIYAKISLDDNPMGTGITSLPLFAALSADELILSDLTADTYRYYYANDLKNLLPIAIGSADYWSTFYTTIFIANSALEGLDKSTNLTPAVKQQLLGEAKFVRAFCYFYLVNFFGDVPLVLSTNWQINGALKQSAKVDVYSQMVADLKDAQDLLSPNYLKADVLGITLERTRPTKWAAAALLSRIYLFTNDWKNAEDQATLIINNKTLYDTVSLNAVFLKNSKEAIWQLQPVGSGTESNTGAGGIFILPPSGPSDATPFYLSNNLANSFESGDMRKVNWLNSVTVGITTYYYPFKYKLGAVNTSPSEYTMVFRLGEQYLIRAEARVQQGNFQGAISDLNAIRTRARLGSTTANTQSSLLSAIQQERRVELFTEWGDRWFNLKRTKTIDAVMTGVTPQKGGTWSPNWQWYPIPLSELAANPKLVQNQGY